MESESSNVEFVLNGGVQLKGKITVRGLPLSRSTFAIYPRVRSSAAEYFSITDQWGNYEFNGVTPGVYEAVAAEYSVEESHRTTFSVPDQAIYTRDFEF
jgi:hypothetical protein